MKRPGKINVLSDAEIRQIYNRAETIIDDTCMDCGYDKANIKPNQWMYVILRIAEMLFRINPEICRQGVYRYNKINISAVYDNVYYPLCLKYGQIVSLYSFAKMIDLEESIIINLDKRKDIDIYTLYGIDQNTIDLYNTTDNNNRSIDHIHNTIDNNVAIDYSQDNTVNTDTIERVKDTDTIERIEVYLRYKDYTVNKRTLKDREYTLRQAMLSSNQNPVKFLAIGNHEYGWQETLVRDMTADKPVLSLQDIPRLELSENIGIPDFDDAE